MCHEKILAEIERLRSVMYKLAEEGSPYDKLLAASRKLDTLIVRLQKQDF